MINSKKKGFTIVELVIVIAVVAILAAVLIPTFSSLIKKANLSADQQAVRQMNTALAIYAAENGKPESIGEVKNALDANDINIDGLTPVTKGYAFYWNPEENTIALVGEGKDQVQDGWYILTSNEFGEYIEATSTNKLDDILFTTNDQGETVPNYSNPVYIKLSEDASLTKATKIWDKYYNSGNGADKDRLYFGANQHVTIDLNGNTLTTPDHCIVIEDNASLTIKNGVIDEKEWGFLVYNGSLTLENVTIINPWDYAIYFVGTCDVTLNETTINSTGKSWAIATNSNKPEYDGARLSITNSHLKANCPIAITTYINVIIEGCTLEGTKHGIVLRGANGIIKNNTITTTSTENDSYEYVDGYGSINTVSHGGIVVMANKQDNGGYSPVGNYTIEGNTITTAGNNPKYVAACGGSSVVTISGITKEEVKEVRDSNGNGTIVYK